MKRAIIGFCAVTAMLISVGSAQAGPISIGLTAAGSGNNLPNATTLANSYGPGSTVTALSDVAFNSMTTATLLASYDALVLGWLGSSGYNFNWASVLLPYINGGGVVIFEDPGNTGDLAGSGLTFTSVGSMTTYNGMFGPNSFTTPHFGFQIAAGSGFNCFLNATSGCYAAYGLFGAGGIIVSGPDEFFHDRDPGNDAFLRSELDFLLKESSPAPVPEPTTLALLGSGVAGLIARRRRLPKAR
jgi:hypothetical protein